MILSFLRFLLSSNSYACLLPLGSFALLRSVLCLHEIARAAHKNTCKHNWLAAWTSREEESESEPPKRLGSSLGCSVGIPSWCPVADQSFHAALLMFGKRSATTTEELQESHVAPPGPLAGLMPMHAADSLRLEETAAVLVVFLILCA